MATLPGYKVKLLPFVCNIYEIFNRDAANKSSEVKLYLYNFSERVSQLF